MMLQSHQALVSMALPLSNRMTLAAPVKLIAHSPFLAASHQDPTKAAQPLMVLTALTAFTALMIQTSRIEGLLAMTTTAAKVLLALLRLLQERLLLHTAMVVALTIAPTEYSRPP